MTDETLPTVDENHLIAERRGKLKALRAEGIAFPNDFKRVDYAGDLLAEYSDAETWTTEKFESLARRVSVAGRLMAKRVMGKASFVTDPGHERTHPAVPAGRGAGRATTRSRAGTWATSWRPKAC
jgi:lysyl-tRNA synthetase class II